MLSSSDVVHVKIARIFARVTLVLAISLPLVASRRASNVDPIQGGQTVTTPAPANDTFDMFFLDVTHGWAVVGDIRQQYDFVFRTDDGGLKWKRIGGPFDFSKLFFLNSEKGWALGSCQIPREPTPQICVFGTSNGGNTWVKLSTAIEPPPRDNDIPLDFRFIDEKRGWIVGQGSSAEGEMFLATIDGGRTFYPVPIELDDYNILNRILSDKEGDICIFGNSSILTSTDRGESWKVQMPSEQTKRDGVSGDLQSGWLFPGGHWLAVGSGSAGMVLSTNDYGRNWKTLTDALTRNSESLSGQLFDISFYDDRNGCATFDWDTIYCTSDRGEMWEPRTLVRTAKSSASFEFDALHRIILLPSGMGWLISDFHFLYQTSDWGRTWNEVDLVKTSAK